MRYTEEAFLEKIKEVHKNKYSYEKTVFINTNYKIIAVCPIHDDFEINAGKHLYGRGCQKCGMNRLKEVSKKSTIQFIDEAKEVHNSRYTYEKTKYTVGREKVVITCKVHGDYNQTASSHLSGSGCAKCGSEASGVKATKKQDIFVNEANIVHENRYSYKKSIYTVTASKIIIECSIHGDFLQTPNSHLQGKGCIKCARLKMSSEKTKSTEEYVSQAKEKHGDKYLYEKTTYISNNKKITIGCNFHGEFTQSPSNHLQGQGCPKCGKESHWRCSDYIKKANGRECTFYTLKCFNENEEFYKIGLTVSNTKRRYPNLTAMPYEYEVISEIKGNAGFIWDLELSEKRKLKTLHYTPKIQFGGSMTECFTDYKI